MALPDPISLPSSPYVHHVDAPTVSGSATIQTVVQDTAAVSTPGPVVSFPSAPITTVTLPPPSDILNSAKNFMKSQPTSSGTVSPKTVRNTMAQVQDFTVSQFLEHNVKHFVLSHLPPGTEVRKPELLKGGGTKGQSGAPVYLIRDSHGTLIAVVKACHQHQELAEELRAQTTLDNLKLSKSQHAQLIGIGKCMTAPEELLEIEYALLFFTVAPGKGFDEYLSDVTKFKKGSAERAQTLEKVKMVAIECAKALAELHSKSPSSYQPDHVKTLANFSIDQRTAFKTKAANFPFLPFDAPALNGIITQLMNMTADFKETAMKGSILHGDPSPGNIFFHEQTNCLTFIDTSSVSQNVNDAGRGIGVAAWDVALFNQKIAEVGRIGSGLSAEEVNVIKEAFDNTYKSALFEYQSAEKMPPFVLPFCEATRVLSQINHFSEQLKALNPDSSEAKELTILLKDRLTHLKLITDIYRVQKAPSPTLPVAKQSTEAMPLLRRGPPKPSRFKQEAKADEY